MQLMFILGNNKQTKPQWQTTVMPHIKQACSELNPTELPLQVCGTRDLDGHKPCTGSLVINSHYWKCARAAAYTDVCRVAIILILQIWKR